MAYWRMDEASGDTLLDIQGDVNDDATLGATTEAPTRITPGKVGSGALEFDGVNDRAAALPSVEVGNTGAGNLITTAMTVQLWMRTDTVEAVWNHWVLNKAHVNGTVGWYLRRFNNDLYFYVRFPGTATVQAVDVLTVGEWAHVVCTVESGEPLKLYVNGVPTGSASSAGSGPVSMYLDNFTFGEWDNSTYNFEGALDEVAVWNRALTGAEVRYLYNDGAGRDVDPPQGTLIIIQ